MLDCDFWSQVERKLPEQEREFRDSKKETRDEFIIRLHKVVRTWPHADIAKAIGDLSRRAKLLYKAKSKLFDEGAEIECGHLSSASRFIVFATANTRNSYLSRPQRDLRELMCVCVRVMPPPRGVSASA